MAEIVFLAQHRAQRTSNGGCWKTKGADRRAAIEPCEGSCVRLDLRVFASIDDQVGG
ncbi:MULTISPECIES: hypothetical protein [Sinorhizobium]|uniref:hypothetical protein n=1 Tax=Sinorhizobium TaxID=28105 RepID=UPI001F372438|nr:MULTISPECIES: hypothetical protein [Sinorhizobium]